MLEPSQNKKGRKNFQLHRFLNTFSQLPAVKKYSKNDAAGKFFDPALVLTVSTGYPICLVHVSMILVIFNSLLETPVNSCQRSAVTALPYLYFSKNLLTPIRNSSGPIKSSNILKTDAPIERKRIIRYRRIKPLCKYLVR